MANKENKWERLPAAPSSVFTNAKEKNLTKQIVSEIVERVIGQQIIYYAVDTDKSNFHPIYDEAVDKVFLPGIQVYCLVQKDESEIEQTGFGVDRRRMITIHFHQKRISEDQNLYVRMGDYLQWNDEIYEIVKTGMPKYLFGDQDYEFEIVATCRKARQGAVRIGDGQQI